jgi:N-acetylglucosamine-1-phosphodiester alpha-N-acetylglucosaminidase
MNSVVSLIVLLLVVSYVSGLTQPSLKNIQWSITADYDLYNYNTTVNATEKFSNWHISGTYMSTGRPFSGYVAIFPASKFSLYPSVESGCKKLVQTSVASSTSYDCLYATNGGFFTWDSTAPSYCLGNLVGDGTVFQLPTDGSGTNRANVGLTADGKIFMGFPDTTVYSAYNFKQLMTGCGWLVRNGSSNVESSPDLDYESTFTTEKAPRTAIGAYRNGTMLLLEVDGEEDINAGPDLFEMTEILINLKVDSAVNIDGGGSSVSVKNGKVISAPTCNDTPEICERAVASITCVRR